METSKFTNKLKNTDNLSAFLDMYKDEFDKNAFVAYITDLMDAKGLNKTSVAELSGLSVPFTHAIFNGTKRPKRDNAIKLAFGMNLTLDEANRLLMLSQHSVLRSKDKRESIIIFCINSGYNIHDANEILESHHEEIINVY